MCLRGLLVHIGHLYSNVIRHVDQQVIQVHDVAATLAMFLFHHQIATCTENVKFRAETVVLVPGTSSGQ